MWDRKLFVAIVLSVLKLSTSSNGFLNNADDAKYYAGILVKSGNLLRQKCGAAIIHRRFVITTASCVFGKNVTDLMVKAGGNKPPSEPYRETRVFKRVARIYYSPDYPLNTLEYDIALIKIIGTFELVDMDYFEKVYLPFFNCDYNGKWATLSGHRQNELKKNETFIENDNFESFDVHVISNKECQNTKNFNLTSGNLCTKPFILEKEHCFGNTGDPLVYNKQIIGLLTTTSCNSTEPQLFTRVSTYINFIKDAMFGHYLF